MRPTLLLLDLDGVAVFELGPPWLATPELIQLHDTLALTIRTLEIPVVVITHRSRREAQRILGAAKLADDGILAGVVAAEDLALAALRRGAWLRLLGRGLRKSLCLPMVEARYGVDRRDMILLDDRRDNLQDLLRNGLGLALLAPSDVEPNGDIISFGLAEVAAIIARWRSEGFQERSLTLQQEHRPLASCLRTGISTARESSHIFNHLRLVARKIRQFVGALGGHRPPPDRPHARM